MFDFLIVSLELGLLYSFLSLSVFLTYRVINYPDLTVDMSSTTGAGTFVVLALSGTQPLIAFLLGCIAAGMAGLVSGILHKKLKLGPILSGILTLSIFYTVNLRIMGRPNISLLSQSNLIPFIGTIGNHILKISFLFLVVVSVKIFLDFFLSTEYGLMARAVGRSEEIVIGLGNDPKIVKIIILFLAGIIFGIGAIFTAEYQGFVDINSGIGNIIIGIASLMLGEALLHPKKISGYTLAACIGAITYELIINMVLQLGLGSSDIKLFTALIVIGTIAISKKEKYELFKNQ